VRALAKSARCVVALSGTPITHHPGDLWIRAGLPGAARLPLLGALGQPVLPRRARRLQGRDPRPEPHTEPEFRLSLLGAFRRVAKADVLTQLPPKVYSVRTVDLPPAWRKSYDDFEARMLAELPDGQELSVMDTLSVLDPLSSAGLGGR
jgi:hypothetical protein